MDIQILRTDPATGIIVLHAVGKPAMTRCTFAGGTRVAVYQHLTEAGQWGAIIEADYRFAPGKRVDALRLAESEKALAASAK